MLFIHHHGTDQHVRIDDTVGIVVEKDSVIGYQFPALDFADLFRFPAFPPIDRSVVADFIHANQTAERTVTVGETRRGYVMRFPPDAIGVDFGSFGVVDGDYRIGREFDHLFVFGGFGDFERIVGIFKN